MQSPPATTDAYARALGHLNAALDAMAACDDTLAVAVIARAVGVVERAMVVRTA